MSRYDFYAELSKQIKEIASLVEDRWNEIWDNRKIKLKRKQSEFKRTFDEEILPHILKTHKLINLDEDKQITYYQIFVISKILDCNIANLSDFAKTLMREAGGKGYYPIIPENLAKEIYLDLFLQQNNKINLNADLSDFGISEDILKLFKITKEFDNPENLPQYSTYLQIKFTLKKPYLSKDDDEFYIIDNPIVKDKVFKLPMVKSTTWKGALRFAAIKVFEDWIYEKLTESKLDKETVFKKRARIVILFGNEKDSQEEYLGKLCLLAIEGKLPTGNELKKKIDDVNKEFEKWLVKNEIISKEIPSRSGRLFFYPTFFDTISLDVITPLSRETKTPVRGPIYFEIVPENTEGIFRLSYYPFDLIARGEFGKVKNELKDDMEFLAKAIRKMLCDIGFSAKKTSGFGVAEIVDVNVVCGAKLKDYEYNIKSFFNKLFRRGWR